MALNAFKSVIFPLQPTEDTGLLACVDHFHDLRFLTLPA